MQKPVDEPPIQAVEMVRRIRDAHYERFKDRPVEERIAYYTERARAFEGEARRTAGPNTDSPAARV